MDIAANAFETGQGFCLHASPAKPCPLCAAQNEGAPRRHPHFFRLSRRFCWRFQPDGPPALPGMGQKAPANDKASVLQSGWPADRSAEREKAYAGQIRHPASAPCRIKPSELFTGRIAIDARIMFLARGRQAVRTCFSRALDILGLKL